MTGLLSGHFLIPVWALFTFQSEVCAIFLLSKEYVVLLIFKKSEAHIWATGPHLLEECGNKRCRDWDTSYLQHLGRYDNGSVWYIDSCDWAGRRGVQRIPCSHTGQGRGCADTALPVRLVCVLSPVFKVYHDDWCDPGRPAEV